MEINRQYIGARYVPKFFENPDGSAEWVKGIQYDPLTIVTHLNNSFTSKKPVPAGVGAPETEPEYWANTGNFSGQIGQLEKKLDSEVAALEAKIQDTADTAQLNLTNEVNKLNASITAVDTKVNNLSPLMREVMAPYGYFGIEWDLDELMELVKAGEWNKFAIGDYFIETSSTGEKSIVEVAGKQSYLHCGNIPLEKNHIVCNTRDCLETHYKYNDTNTNEGGYAASLMPANLETEANKFSAKLQGYMTTIQRMENNKGAWAWASRRIFLPGNPELIGFHGWSDAYDGGAPNQLPLFVGGNAHLLKGAGFNKKKLNRMWYWTADPSAANTTLFCALSDYGHSYDTIASGVGGVAPLFVLS